MFHARQFLYDFQPAASLGLQIYSHRDHNLNPVEVTWLLQKQITIYMKIRVLYIS